MNSASDTTKRTPISFKFGMLSFGVSWREAGVQCRTQYQLVFVVVVVVVVVVDLKVGRVLGDDRLDYRLVPPRIRCFKSFT